MEEVEREMDLVEQRDRVSSVVISGPHSMGRSLVQLKYLEKNVLQLEAEGERLLFPFSSRLRTPSNVTTLKQYFSTMHCVYDMSMLPTLTKLYADEVGKGSGM